jgi:hypothetical protein
VAGHSPGHLTSLDLRFGLKLAALSAAVSSPDFADVEAPAASAPHVVALFAVVVRVSVPSVASAVDDAVPSAAGVAAERSAASLVDVPAPAFVAALRVPGSAFAPVSPAVAGISDCYLLPLAAHCASASRSSGCTSAD